MNSIKNTNEQKQKGAWLFDSHAHLDDPRFDKDRDEVILKNFNSGVKKIINIGANIETSKNSIKLAQKHDFIYATCGVHPHNAKSYDANTERQLQKLAENEKVVAIGEIGLDYHYDNSPREKQKEVFISQIRLAKELGLPIVIHDREAHKDCLDILEKEKTPGMKGVFHCYSGSAEMVRQIIDMDFYISFTGVITFKNANKILRAVEAVPLDKLLSETDCPYLSPEPVRGRRNHPGNVRYVVEQLAKIKEINYKEMCKILWNNTHELFQCLPNDGYMIK